MDVRRKRLLALLLVLSLFGAACSQKETTKSKKKKETTYEKHKMSTTEPSETEEPTEPSQRDTSVRPVATPSPTPEVIPILTEQDIQAMNNNSAIIVRNDDGYVSTIVGRFFHRPVTDADDAINAIKGLQTLLGLETGYFPFAVYGATYEGCTYFTYQQLKDDSTVLSATLKIALDQEGYPYVLQSSLATNLDYTITPPTIDEAQAEQVVLSRMGDGYTVYSQYTKKTSFQYEYNAEHCFQVYTNNPSAGISFDMPYIVHFVDFDGNYIRSYPTGFLPDDSQFVDYGNESYFKDMQPTDMTFTIDRNGEDFTFTVPISYNPNDGMYYLADPSRKIIMADFYEFVYNNDNLVFKCQASANSWPDNYLATYYNYILAYDFYKRFNIESTDGFGMPILILMGYCDQDGTPVNNACNMGVTAGWSLFGAAECNTYGYSLDILGHEYTHGVTNYCRQGSIYANEYGAINEAFSDIMGNMCEMYMGETSDTTWLMGETSGNVCRSMSNPYEYNQPMYVGDQNYLPPSPLGLRGYRDNGGVHVNNSLVSHLCYVLYQSGMPLEDLIRFFLCAIEMHTPWADYDDMYAIFVAAAQMSGYAQIVPIIDEYWQAAQMSGDRNIINETTSVQGYQKINIPFASSDLASRCVVLVFSYYGQNEITEAAAQSDGVATVTVPVNGDKIWIEVWEFADSSLSSIVNQKAYNTSMSGWTTDPYEMGVYDIESGDIHTTATYS